jgi:hypothetical protein
MKFRKTKGWKYQLIEELTIELSINNMPNIRTEFVKLFDRAIVLSKYYAWDGASGPCPDLACLMEASVLHDGLYQLMRLGLLDKKYRKFADREFCRVAREKGLNKVGAFLIYWGVRIFAARGVERFPENIVYETP